MIAGPSREAASKVNDDFPPIADYGFLSDCEVNCLVAPNSAIEWLCLPRPDSPSLFGAILDRRAGSFRFGPDNAKIPHVRRYVPGTMVLETTWHTPTGWLVVNDLLVMAPDTETLRQEKYRRAPGDTVATGTLLRLATCIDGRVDVEIDCSPSFEYGTLSGSFQYSGDGYNAMTVRPQTIRPQPSDLSLSLTSSMRLGTLAVRCIGRCALERGDSAFVALSWGDKAVMTLEEAEAAVATTAQTWRDWLKTSHVPDHRWRQFIERSALTLKGLSYAPTGAIMAAATTSLPETPGGARNWDYRYTWIRDSSFMLRSLYRLGFNWEAVSFFAFVLDAVLGGAPVGAPPDGVALQIMYGIGGERDLTERTLDHLSGWRHSRPVRVGNGAYDQLQLDMWGMLLDSVETQVNRVLQQLAQPTWEAIASLVDQAVEHRHDADQGIWEVRGEPQEFTASKVMCWVAVDRGVRLAQQRGEEERAAAWRSAADDIKAEVLDKGVSSRGVFRQHYNTEDLDAALLLIPLMGFLPPGDERVRATVIAIADELTEDGFVLRYRTDTTDTGFEGKEGTFTICSFWLVTALAMIGEVARARALCEKLLSFAGPLLLYAEEIDTSTGEHLGNFPQAFTHLALIEAVSQVIEAEQNAAAP
jgi:GH15 family glucan-1,4-alpha-glucosidase